MNRKAARAEARRQQRAADLAAVQRERTSCMEIKAGTVIDEAHLLRQFSALSMLNSRYAAAAARRRSP